MGLGLPGRPGGDPGALSRLSGQWNSLANSLEDSLQQLNPHASWVYDWWQGGGADAYTTSWENYSPHITALISSIRGVATQLSTASSKISSAQSRYDTLAASAAAAAAGGLFLTVFTVGISDGVAAGVDGGIAATITAMLVELGEALSAIGEAISAGFAELQGLILSLQLSLGTATGVLVTGAAGAVFSSTALYMSGDHNLTDLGVAALFGFGSTADPGFGQGGDGDGDDDGDPVVGTGDGDGSGGTSSSDLIAGLQADGVKISADDVVSIEELPNGQVVWLENGSPSAGLEHIEQEHATDFENVGIAKADIPKAIMQALSDDDVVGTQGRGRPIYQTTINGQTVRIAITVGSNGFIVGANPTSAGG